MSNPRMQRGAVPTPSHKMLRAIPFRPLITAPVQFAIVPPELSNWGNDQYGDCHDDATEVLTENGWKHWTDYDGQSLLGTMNQGTGLLEFQAPTAIVRHHYDGPMVYSDHRRLDFAVTPGHRLYYSPYSRCKSAYEPYRFDTMDNLPCQFSIHLATTGFLGTSLKRLAIGSREWDGDDLLRLIAVIISDGCVAQPEARDRNRIEFVCFREDRYEKVAALAYRLGIKEKPSAKGVWGFSDGALAEWLRANTFTGNKYKSPFKHVPDLVKIAAQEQIEMFLDFFGDQTATNESGRHFTSVSKRMVDDLQELLLRIGKAGTIYDGYTHNGAHVNGRWIECHNPVYTLHQPESPDVCLHQVKNGNGASNLRRDHYSGEVFCATVPNSTLVTRRNGRVVVTSNCVTAEEAFAKAAYSLQCSLPEVFVSRADVITWARKHGVLNGAMLDDVMDKMARDGLPANGAIYTDGGYHGVDYSDEGLLQSAIAQGPVKIGIAANGLPSTAGDFNGWYSVSTTKHGRIDHCVALCGYGAAQWLYQQLGVALPAGLAPTTAGYLLFTWGTIGFVTHGWLMGNCEEAWVRQPTTVGQIPPSPIPPQPTNFPEFTGPIFAEPFPGGIAIRGEPILKLLATQKPGDYQFIVVPKGDGTYGLIPKPIL